MNSILDYDIAFIGHYTKDTIISPAGKRVVDGGAFNYGSHVAIRMGLKVAAITRLAPEAVSYTHLDVYKRQWLLWSVFFF